MDIEYKYRLRLWNFENTKSLDYAASYCFTEVRTENFHYTLLPNQPDAQGIYNYTRSTPYELSAKHHVNLIEDEQEEAAA